MHANQDTCKYLLIHVNIFLSVNHNWACILVPFLLLHFMFMRMEVLMQHC